MEFTVLYIIYLYILYIYLLYYTIFINYIYISQKNGIFDFFSKKWKFFFHILEMQGFISIIWKVFFHNLEIFFPYFGKFKNFHFLEILQIPKYGEKKFQF